MKRLKIAGGILACLALAWGADSVAAMHAEHSLAQRVQDAARLETSPNVYIGGMPYLGALVTGEIPLVEVGVMDVEVPRLGMINAATTVRDLTVAPQQVFSGDFEGGKASTISRSISLDGVALGRLLDMTDLSIANPDNISPSGGTAAEAELTGTIPGAEEKSTVQVDLRLEGPMFYMRPSNAPDAATEQAFSLELDTRSLPLPEQATMVSLRGGSISFEVQRRNRTLSNGQLSPVEIEGEFDETGKENGAD